VSKRKNKPQFAFGVSSYYENNYYTNFVDPLRGSEFLSLPVFYNNLTSTRLLSLKVSEIIFHISSDGVAKTS
jgi:hypothetical protein